MHTYTSESTWHTHRKNFVRQQRTEGSSSRGSRGWGTARHTAAAHAHDTQLSRSLSFALFSLSSSVKVDGTLIQSRGVHSVMVQQGIFVRRSVVLDHPGLGLGSW